MEAGGPTGESPLELGARTERALAARGLLLAEYHLLGAAAQRSPLPRFAFVAYARTLAEGDPLGECTLDQLDDAFDGLVARGWMVVLDDAALGAERERRQHPAVPEVWDLEYHRGDVDLTGEGYLAYRELLLELFGEESLHYHDTGFSFAEDASSCRFDVYSPRPELCLELMEEIVRQPESYTAVSAPALVERVAPAPIGEWKPNRFFSRPSGYRGVLHYRSGAAP